ncbi:hypothetical protein MXB_3114 [Myxobolus squamalis]|nr:hypothetical protein MXB_3114 [Myxobolus squamalis]
MTKVREDLIAYASLAERTERFGEMFDYMLEVVKLGENLSEDDRNLLSVASKNAIGPKRSSCRFLLILEDKHSGDALKMECLKLLREKVVAEMTVICNTLVKCIQECVLTKEYPPNETCELALAELQPNDPVRLGLMLNMSVFFYEVQENILKAQKLVRDTLDFALQHGDETENHRDSGVILQLLRDNLTLWNTEIEKTPDDNVSEEKSDSDESITKE